jgi:hypothetical protein
MRQMNPQGYGTLLLMALLACPVWGQEGGARPSRITSPGTSTFSPQELRDLVRTAAEHDMENDKKSRDYTYVVQEVHQRLGRGRKSESKTYEVMTLYDEQVRRLISKNGQPLSAQDAAKEEARIQRFVDKRKNESAENRQKRLEKQERQREKARRFVGEIADAYNFRLVGREEREGREDYVIDADPRPGFQPHSREARVLSKFRFRVWIDQAEKEWVKLDAQSIDTVSFGWFLARLHKGARVLVEQTYVNNDVWLPRHVNITFDARLALLKKFNENVDLTFRDYKKFRAHATIVPAKQAQP